MVVSKIAILSALTVMQFNAMQRRRAAKVLEFLFCCFDELCAMHVSSSTGEFPLEQLSLTCVIFYFSKNPVYGGGADRSRVARAAPGMYYCTGLLEWAHT